jgi:hypothetical protein
MRRNLLPPIVAGLGIIGCAIGLVLAPAGLARAWLVATTTLIGLPLGAMVLLMFFAMTGGRWGEAARPALQAIAATLPAMLVLFLPLLAAIPALMPFLSAPPDTLPDRVALKLAYLAPGWIIVRTLIVFAMWLGAAALNGVLPVRARLTPKPAAAIGLILYALALTVFSTDWMQALEPQFTSTIYAMMVGGTQMLGGFALAIVVLALTRPVAGEAGGGPEASLGDDLGKLLIAGILSFVYLAYMQWLIIWIGDLPPEAAWYVAREAPPWSIAFWVMVLAYAVLPFLALLLSSVRRDARRLTAVSIMILLGHAAEGIWRVAPAFAPDLPYLLLLVAAFAAVGGLFAFVLAWQWRSDMAVAEVQHVR